MERETRRPTSARGGFSSLGKRSVPRGELLLGGGEVETQFFEDVLHVLNAIRDREGCGRALALADFQVAFERRGHFRDFGLQAAATCSPAEDFHFAHGLAVDLFAHRIGASGGRSEAAIHAGELQFLQRGVERRELSGREAAAEFRAEFGQLRRRGGANRGVGQLGLGTAGEREQENNERQPQHGASVDGRHAGGNAWERSGRGPFRRFATGKSGEGAHGADMVPFSILDLAFITEGHSAAEALHRARALAQHAERLGYRRFWLAEHHNMPGIASAATAVVIGHVAAGTSTIRVGAGGVMLPNHSPLVIAEQFGTLASLYPGRIDLGLGRAPGTDPVTARALRRGAANTADTFPDDVIELQSYFEPTKPGQLVQAVPGAGLEVPIWLLGSSLFSAQLAAALGLPFAFASHFAPDHLDEALALYRRGFQPSAVLDRPYAMVAIGAYVADTDEEARRLATSWQQSFLNLRRGHPSLLPPPVESMDGRWSPLEQAAIEHASREAVIGSPATVRRRIEAFLERTHVDELMFASAIYDPAARHRSFELLARLRGA